MRAKLCWKWAARAINLAAYNAEAGIAEIAAAYAFMNGNKRTAFMMTVTFLRLNGSSFRPAVVEGVRMMEDLASGHINEAEVAR